MKMQGNKKLQIELRDVRALLASCNECGAEEACIMKKDSSGKDRRTFLSHLDKKGWIETDPFGTLCSECKVKLRMAAE